MLALRDRLDGRFNAERLQQPHDLGSDRLSVSPTKSMIP
ncbi:hypothetical protein MPL3365_170178 [Mesorhizobium plurifarium]|uniref:Uncharacterized protein n=1 Tax=Mesorhizobium plurifarium TaxID=69974 RepID=A0A090FZ29_MESPL|nr:hypothetical protein MPL3365_170178 [Mesorhizobium plurifarium]